MLAAPLVAMLLYGALEFKRSWVGIPISVITLVALYFVWVPTGAAVVAETLQLGTRDDLVVYSFVGLLFLVLLNLHLKNRRRMQIVTTLIRQIAITSRQTIPRRMGAPGAEIGAPRSLRLHKGPSSSGRKAVDVSRPDREQLAIHGAAMNDPE